MRPKTINKNKYLCKGPPTTIEVNMQVRSMGPISELDMVIYIYTLLVCPSGFLFASNKF